MQNEAIPAATAPRARPFLPILTAEERERAFAARKAKREAWSKLDLRQAWADEVWMRGFLVRAGVRIGSDLEPATPQRLRLLLQRAGLTHDQWGAAVGCILARFLELNPCLPLWAATALILEASDLFATGA